MNYEVEMKFPVSDEAALEARLAELGATISAPQAERDVYFAHPARDFAHTDEALRVRRKGPANFLTYKGPKLDTTTKTRHEIDLPLPPDEETAQAWTGLLDALGFTVAGEVRKSRRKAHVPWQGRRVEVSLDEVERLGTFVELELVVEPAEAEAAKRCIASLAERLQLEKSERRSYLELLRAVNRLENSPPALSSGGSRSG
jgi:adenylate cyclase class 2